MVGGHNKEVHTWDAHEHNTRASMKEVFYAKQCVLCCAVLGLSAG